MIMAPDQPAAHFGRLTRVRRDVGDRAQRCPRVKRFRHHIVKIGRVRGAYVRHAMVGQHDQVGVGAKTARIQSGQQLRQRGVDGLHGLDGLGREGSRRMRGDVVLFHVQGDEPRAFVRRKIQPRQHFGHALVGRQLAVERPPMVRARTRDLRFRTGPEHRCRLQSRTARGHPDGLAAPEPAVPPRRLLGLESAQHRVLEVVVHDAVPIRAQSRHQRVVVGEGQRGVRRIDPRRPRTLGEQRIERGHAAGAGDVGAQAIDGDQQQGGRRS